MIILAMAAALLSAQEPDCRDPQDQSSMNICADRDFRTADAELNRTYQRAVAAARREDAALERNDPFPRYEPSLRAAQRAWVAFRDAQCIVEGMQDARGGSMEPMLVSGCMERMTRERINQFISAEVRQ
jgi:uncharacterized protein YecT (DUF1311 family)